MIDIEKVQGAMTQQCDINDTVLRIFEKHQSRIEFLESELSAIQESLAYVEAGR